MSDVGGCIKFKFKVAGFCVTALCDCYLFDGMLDGNVIPPLHEGCTCVLERRSGEQIDEGIRVKGG